MTILLKIRLVILLISKDAITLRPFYKSLLDYYAG